MSAWEPYRMDDHFVEFNKMVTIGKRNKEVVSSDHCFRVQPGKEHVGD